MRKIKTALLSYGMSGKVFHAPFIHLQPQFELAGCWERSKKSIQEKYPYTKSFQSFEEILDDSSIELVVVNTPTYTHFDYASKALLANKHVIVEKAFTSSVAEAVTLKQLAAQQNKIISVYQNRRWDSDFTTVKQIIDSKVLGTINEMEIHFDRFRIELSSKQHKEAPNSGAGIVKDLGPHLIDQALVLFGMPQHIFADIRITRPHSVIDDYFDILLYYPATRIRLKSGYIVKQALPAYIVHGTKGSFIKSRADVQEADLQKGLLPNANNWGIEPADEAGILVTDDNGKTVKQTIETLQGNYLAYYNNMYQAITQHTSPAVTADDGINVMKLIEAAFKSNDDKEVITL